MESCNIKAQFHREKIRKSQKNNNDDEQLSLHKIRDQSTKEWLHLILLNSKDGTKCKLAKWLTTKQVLCYSPLFLGQNFGAIKLNAIT